MDLHRTQQIIINFLSNAIKFSPENSIVIVQIQCVLNRQFGLYKTQISVQDNGIGIEAADLGNLFQPYFKSDNLMARALNSGGHGLGLSVCQKIAKSLDGNITCQTQFGEGTKMTFKFLSPVSKKQFVVKPQKVLNQRRASFCPKDKQKLDWQKQTGLGAIDEAENSSNMLSSCEH